MGRPSTEYPIMKDSPNWAVGVGSNVAVGSGVNVAVEVGIDVIVGVTCGNADLVISALAVSFNADLELNKGL